MKGLDIVFISREQQKSVYDWATISFNDLSVGKARCLINDNEFTIFSINIYPEYQGNGYGSAFVEDAKKRFIQITADRVRSTAIGFWERVGFRKDGDTENWIYLRESD